MVVVTRKQASENYYKFIDKQDPPDNDDIVCCAEWSWVSICIFLFYSAWFLYEIVVSIVNPYLSPMLQWNYFEQEMDLAACTYPHEIQCIAVENLWWTLKTTIFILTSPLQLLTETISSFARISQQYKDALVACNKKATIQYGHQLISLCNEQRARAKQTAAQQDWLVWLGWKTWEPDQQSVYYERIAVDVAAILYTLENPTETYHREPVHSAETLIAKEQHVESARITRSLEHMSELYSVIEKVIAHQQRAVNQIESNITDGIHRIDVSHDRIMSSHLLPVYAEPDGEAAPPRFWLSFFLKSLKMVQSTLSFGERKEDGSVALTATTAATVNNENEQQDQHPVRVAERTTKKRRAEALDEWQADKKRKAEQSAPTIQERVAPPFDDDQSDVEFRACFSHATFLTKVLEKCSALQDRCQLDFSNDRGLDVHQQYFSTAIVHSNFPRSPQLFLAWYMCAERSRITFVIARDFINVIAKIAKPTNTITFEKRRSDPDTLFVRFHSSKTDFTYRVRLLEHSIDVEEVCTSEEMYGPPFQVSAKHFYDQVMLSYNSGGTVLELTGLNDVLTFTTKNENGMNFLTVLDSKLKTDRVLNTAQSVERFGRIGASLYSVEFLKILTKLHESSSDVFVSIHEQYPLWMRFLLVDPRDKQQVLGTSNVYMCARQMDNTA